MSRLLSSQPPVETPGITVRYPISGSASYLILTRDKRVWNPMTERWITCNTWPRISFLVRGVQKNLSILTAWSKAFARAIDRVATQDKADLTERGYPGYWVTRDGRVWSDVWGRWCKVSKCAGDKLGVNINGTPVPLHRLMALGFLPNPNGWAYAIFKSTPHVCTLTNIEWWPSPRKTGYTVQRYTQKTLDDAIELLGKGLKIAEVVAITGVTRTHLYNLRKRVPGLKRALGRPRKRVRPEQTPSSDGCKL